MHESTMPAPARRVLVVEDDPDISSLIRLHLESAGFDVRVVSDGHSGLQGATSGDFDLVILDVGLPALSGLDVCHHLVERASRPLILMLTVLSTPHDRVRGLEMGADDYLVKPFSFEELLARVRALLRRPPLAVEPVGDSATHLFTAGGLVLDSWERSVRLPHRHIELTAREFDLLLFFVRNPLRVFSRAELLDAVWGSGYEGYEHTVNSHVNRLRTKLEEDPTRPAVLVTVRGGGYKLVPPRNTARPIAR
jgi:DNA-binding response OmpR family regulator